MPNTDGRNAPADNAVAVTPHDSTDLSEPTRALWIGVAGDISVEMLGTGTTIIFTNASGWMPIRVTRVNSTNTTATNITAVY